MPLSLQISTKIALDEKMRRCVADSHISFIIAADRRYPNRHRRKHWPVCCEEGTAADNCGEPMDRKTEPVFSTLSDGEESEQIWKVSTNRICYTRPMTMLNTKQ